MWSVKKLLVFLMIAGGVSACSSGSGNPGAATNFIIQAGDGRVPMTSHKFTPPGYPFQPFPKAPTPVDNQGGGEVVLDENPAQGTPDTPPTPENSEPAPAPVSGTHAMVTGNIVHPGYAGGDFLIETRAAVSCGDQTCPDMSSKPFASLKVSGVGYFALVMAQTDVPVFAVATYSHPTDGTSTREVELGVVNQRANGVVFDFTAEEPAAEEATLSPEQAKALQDLFDNAQKAQEDLNDMVHSALGNMI